MSKQKFGIKHEVNKILLSQKGVGLVAVMIAAALIVAAALVVGNFISDQYRRSAVLEISGDCQTIANSLVEYIKKDESSLFIASYGPASTGAYSSGLATTDDGLDQFAFLATSIRQFKGTGTMTIPPGTQKLPAPWKSYNQLNIKNSTNRLLALASSGNYCCDGLDMNSASCGSLFYDDSTPVPGFKITNKDVKVNLAIDFKEKTCTGQKLAPADLLDASNTGAADFKVRVTMNQGTPQQKTCEGTGTVQRTPDNSAPLSIIQYDRSTLCAGPAVSPAICYTTANVTVDVRTFKSNAGTACETSCLQAIGSNLTCAQTAAAGGAPDLFDAFSNATCASCLQAEPGTAFLCRIGEKRWMDTHPNVWEPCENTTVKDFDGTSAGAVAITYTPLLGASLTQKTTNARIVLSGLTKNRGYVVDVRAVDTAGNVGPSFCEDSQPGVPGSLSCASGQPAQFVIMNSAPAFGAFVENNNFVGPTSKLVQGRDNTLITTTPPKYTNVLSPFTNNYQCQDGAPQFEGHITYAPPIPVGAEPFTHTCAAVLTYPTPPAIAIPSAAAAVSPGCNCVLDNCRATLPNLTDDGDSSLVMTAFHPCGQIVSPTQNWCKDTAPLSITQTGTVGNYGSTPNFSTLVTGVAPSPKKCNFASLCPDANGTTFTVKYGTTCDTPTGWSAQTQSGCLSTLTGNYCSVAVDACGRYAETTPIKYSTLLRLAPTTNGCFSFGGSQVGGNSCESGWCSIVGQCQSGCAKFNMNCSNSGDCQDPSYGGSASCIFPAAVGTCSTLPISCTLDVQCADPMVPGVETCVFPIPVGKCDCPGNTSTPTTGGGPLYCPILNSCPGFSPPPLPAPSPLPPLPVPPLPVVNGACGPANGTTVAAAPTIGLCSAGAASILSGTGPWTWTCSGSGGGTNASCSASSNGLYYNCVDGWTTTCGSVIVDWAELNPSCPGTAYVDSTTVWNASSGAYNQYCKCTTGVKTHVGVDDCLYVRRYYVCAGGPGVCGTANGVAVGSAPSSNLCSMGTPSPVSGAGPWNWTCSGAPSAPCAAPKLPPPTLTFFACFVAGTQVTMADGSLKDIEKVKVGEKTLTYDEVTGKQTISPVEQVFHHPEKISDLYTITLSDGTSVTSNDVHPYFLPDYGEYASAAEIYQQWLHKVDLRLLNNKNKMVAITHIEKTTKSVKLYNLHMTSIYDQGSVSSKYGHNYFAGGVLVHNLKCLHSCNEQAFGDQCCTASGGTSVVTDMSNNATTECYINPVLAPAVSACVAASLAGMPDASCPGDPGCSGGCEMGPCTGIPRVYGFAAAGVCGSANGVARVGAPTLNLCSTGTASPIFGAGPWTWSCSGSPAAACSAPKSFGLGMCCSYYVAPWGYNDPTFVGTLAECQWMKANHGMGGTCEFPVFQGVPPAACSGDVRVLVDTGATLGLAAQPFSCIPYDGP